MLGLHFFCHLLIYYLSRGSSFKISSCWSDLLQEFQSIDEELMQEDRSVYDNKEKWLCEARERMNPKTTS